MEVYRPYRPAHQSTEFWYYHKGGVLLFGNRGKPLLYGLEAEHSQQDREAHYREGQNAVEQHSPHGLTFKDKLLTALSTDQERR